jgi:hypothetical protein
MEVFTEEELKIPPVKYECKNIRMNVYRHIRNFVHYCRFSSVLFKGSDKFGQNVTKLLHSAQVRLNFTVVCFVVTFESLNGN